tara:strand:- start:333 stop:1313 length:981 start_codon:yes stop_codon:yes gene_type:complete
MKIIKLAFAFLAISFSSLTFSLTDEEVETNLLNGVKQTHRLYNLALENEATRQAFGVCMKKMDIFIDDIISEKENSKSTLFRTSEKNQVDQLIWQFQMIKQYEGLAGCFSRWLLLLAHFEFPIGEVLGAVEDGTAPPSDQELESLISDYEESFYSTIATFLVYSTTDIFIANGPWTLSETDMNNMWSSMSNMLGLSGELRAQAYIEMSEKASTSSALANNIIVNQQTQIFNKIYGLISNTVHAFSFNNLSLNNWEGQIKTLNDRNIAPKSTIEGLKIEAEKVFNFMNCKAVDDKIIKFIEKNDISVQQGQGFLNPMGMDFRICNFY